MQISTTTAIDRKIPNTLLSLCSVLIFDLAVFTGDCIRLHRDNHALNRYFIDFRKDPAHRSCEDKLLFAANKTLLRRKRIFVCGKQNFLHRKRTFVCGKQDILRRKRIFVCSKQNLLRRKPTFVCGKTKHSSSQTNICLWQTK